jgi:uncharacterized protein YoxC
MAIDTKAWMKSVGFSDEKIAQLLPEFEPVAEGLERSVMMRSDHSRELDRIRKLQEDLDAKNEKLTADIAEWAEMSSAEKAANGDLREKIEAAQTKVYDLTQKVTRLATDAGIDPKTILGDGTVDPPVKKQDPPAAFDPTPLQAQIGGIAEYMITLAGELPAIAEEHLRLTGERLDTRAFTNQIKADIATGKFKPGDLDPVTRWEKQFDIPAKRTAAAEKAVDDRIKAARAEERSAVLSEQALPGGGNRPGHTAPVFKTTSVGTGSKLQRPQPGARLAGAVSALATGKYRTGGGGRPAA